MHFKEEAYAPSQADIDAYLAKHHAVLWHDFALFAMQARYPLRCWRTFAIMLIISGGRPKFLASIARINFLSRQARRTVQLALPTLHRDGWITWRRRQVDQCGWWVESEYEIPRLGGPSIP